MQEKSLAERSWFVLSLAMMGLMVTSAVFSAKARQEHQQVRQVAPSKHTPSQPAPDRGMIVIR